MKEDLSTTQENTWCPGCLNFMVLESVKRALSKFEQKNLAMVTGIGCHAKIFDYLNISGIYGLHGRVIPTAQGIKFGNPNLDVIGFAGDGDTYAEGMAHFIHAFRNNINMTLVVFDNQSFSLTTGQPTPTSQKGYVSKSVLGGETRNPVNPISLALASGGTFIARANARDINHTAEIIEKAIKHDGFSFVEIVQDCLIFNPEANNKDKKMYKIDDNKKKDSAEKFAKEYDYSLKDGKIPVGVIYYE